MDTGGRRTNPEHESENFRGKKQGRKRKRKKKTQKGGKMTGGYRLIVGYSVHGVDWNLTWEFEVVDTWQPNFQS